MNCTNKEQETCDVEKRGCQFCYYDEEIKVGEYIRTKFGKLLKIDGPRDMGYIEKGNPYFRQQISKHSKNIIDLIEVRRLCKWT